MYFSARLAADPETAKLAQVVDAIVEGVDEAFVTLRDARRGEVRARALRDHRDKLGDRGVRRYGRSVRVVEASSFVHERLFPAGVARITAPRGRAQLERLGQLRQATQDLIDSEQLGAHPEAAELHEILERGQQMIDAALDSLQPAIEDWETQVVEVGRARDLFHFRRADGVMRLGALIGELRALLGGSVKEAYSYTSPARAGRSAATDEGPEDMGEAEVAAS